MGDSLMGEDGDDYLSAGAGHDMVDGGAGNDVLNGGTGADYLVGGGGNDTYSVDSADDYIEELAGGGVDTVYSTVTERLDANVENLRLQGSAALNGWGNGLDNEIYGNDGANTLYGYEGNDRLYGGNGDDTLGGDAGELSDRSGRIRHEVQRQPADDDVEQGYSDGTRRFSRRARP